MKYIDDLCDEARSTIDQCARMNVELSEWQQNWINNWVKAGRPRPLKEQYRLACSNPIIGERRIERVL
jgi:hypothetical protein